MKTISLTLCFFALFAVSAFADTLIVLDASGSMRERIHGDPKIEIARDAVRELVQSLPADTRLGLVVYSHRKNDCNDIQLVIPPGKLDKPAFIKAVDGINPLGPTPLSASIQFAADALGYKTNKANIILVSDGLETCGKDPCATAKALKKAAADLTIHAVAFDLSAKEGKSFECIAKETGGRFLQANDAASLKDAIAMAVTEAVVTTNKSVTPEVLGTATIKAPSEVVAGSIFPVEWTGPTNYGDYITIVPKGTADDIYGNTSYTHQGSPLKLTALIEPGDAEIRYVTSRSHTVLARAPIKIVEALATLSAADTATAGSAVAVTWTGPNNRGDYITFAAKGAKDGDYLQYMNTQAGSPLKVSAPVEPADYEIRYMTGQGGKVLGRRPIKIIAAEVTLSAADEATVGAAIPVTWMGPNNNGDYITIVSKGSPDGKYGHYMNTQAGSLLKVTAPMEPGDCEIRYMTGQGAKVLARRPIKLIAAEITLSAPDEAITGSTVSVAWTGPDNNGDYITIVSASAADGKYNQYKLTREGSPLKLTAPMEPGASEVRYMTGQGAKVLARRSITLKEAQITLKAAEKASVNSVVQIEWTGPNNSGDYITIVPKDAKEGVYLKYTDARNGSPAKVAAPPTPGPCEIRYVSGQGAKTLGRVPIEITP